MEEKILLFIPMYNCEKQITRVLGRLDDEVMRYVSKVIVVNNRSTDNSEQVVREYLTQHRELPAVLVRNTENYGLGGSHKVAFGYAIDNGYDYVIVLHGDDQSNIHDMLPVLRAGTYREHDCSMGARFVKGSKFIGYSKFKRFGNYVYGLLFAVALGRKVPELGSNLKIYKTSMLKSRYYHKFCDDMTFDYCMTLASGCLKQDYMYFPFTLRVEDQVSNVKLISQAIQVLKLLARYIAGPKKFITSELRAAEREAYTFDVIYENA